jgi:hypothetical protein
VRGLVDGNIADLMILAINALEIAMGKKYVAYSIGSAYSRLLSPVDANGGNAERGITVAIAGLPFNPVCIAIPWAECAFFKFFKRFGKRIKNQGRGGFFRYFWKFNCKTKDKDD